MNLWSFSILDVENDEKISLNGLNFLLRFYFDLDGVK